MGAGQEIADIGGRYPPVSEHLRQRELQLESSVSFWGSKGTQMAWL